MSCSGDQYGEQQLIGWRWALIIIIGWRKKNCFVCPLVLCGRGLTTYSGLPSTCILVCRLRLILVDI
jgi:hypothetical protein